MAKTQLCIGDSKWACAGFCRQDQYLSLKTLTNMAIPIKECKIYFCFLSYNIPIPHA